MQDRYHNTDPYAAFRFAADIDQQPLPWLWPQRIPLATLTLLLGDPGVGKSLLAADIAARVSTATAWPTEAVSPEPRRVRCADHHPLPDNHPQDDQIEGARG